MQSITNELEQLDTHTLVEVAASYLSEISSGDPASAHDEFVHAVSERGMDKDELARFEHAMTNDSAAMKDFLIGVLRASAEVSPDNEVLLHATIAGSGKRLLLVETSFAIALGVVALVGMLRPKTKEVSTMKKYHADGKLAEESKEVKLEFQTPPSIALLSWIQKTLSGGQ